MTPPDRPTIWAYAYRLLPPLAPSRMHKLQRLLEKEQTAARAREGKWEARFVTDDRVAHILVLSDSPDLDGEANKRIEAELRRLEASYSLTVPLAVDEGEADLPPKD